MKIFELIRKVSNETLVERCRKDDPKAQRELYDRFAPKILVVCKRYVTRYEIAEEVLSNSFIKAFRSIGFLEQASKIEGWLRKIAVRESLDYLKANTKIWTNLDELVGSAEPFEADASHLLSAAELLAMIEKLPVGYRTVFNLFAMEGYKHFEIAEMLGISENTSKTQLMKARIFLQKMILNLEEQEKNYGKIR